MIPTVSTSQYDRCSGSTSLRIAAAAVQIISRKVNSQAIRPPITCSAAGQRRARTRSDHPGASPRAGGTGTASAVQFPDSTRASDTMASRRASAPGDGDHCGGMGGSAGPSRPARS